jgi:hypothetical protein
MTTTEILRNLIREEVKKALANRSLTEDFASPILRKLLVGIPGKNGYGSGYSKEINKAFYNFTKVALDKVEDSDIQKMDPSSAYKTLKKNGGADMIVFYISEKGGENPYAKSNYDKQIKPGTLLGIATGDNKFYSINYPRWRSSERGKIGPTMSQGTGDNLGVGKTGSGYGSTGLYNVKRVSEVADAAYVIDLSKLQATKSTKEKIALRTTQKSGAVAFMTAKQFKEDNMKRYQTILRDRAAGIGTDMIIKGVQAAIQTVSNAMSQAVGSMTTGKYSDIIVGKDPKGREVKASDAANFLRNMLDNFERYVSTSKQAEEAKKAGYDGSSYYDEQVKSYALQLKQQITKANNMDYAW